MKTSIPVLASGALALLLASQTPEALALSPLTYGPSGVCPIDYTTTSDCNLFINFNADGSITTTGSGGNYDGIEDALIGVRNHTGSAISSFSISSTSTIPIFDFETDGINTYTNVTNAAAGHSDAAFYTFLYNQLDVNNNPAHITTTNVDEYGGADAYFTGVNLTTLNAGTVHFLTPIASGSHDYFSLESSIDISAPPTVCSGDQCSNYVPEPASLALLGLGLVGLGAMRRRAL